MSVPELHDDPSQAEDPWRDLAEDFKRYGEGSWLGRLLLNQGLWAACQYRFARWVRLKPRRRILKPVASALLKLVEITAGISISGDSRWGPGLYIGHFGGVVIGPGVRGGRDCNISQGVTMGTSVGDAGRGSPVLGCGVYIAPGAVISGPITIGSRVAIGANAVVRIDLPDDALAAGVPARVIRINPRRPEDAQPEDD